MGRSDRELTAGLKYVGLFEWPYSKYVVIYFGEHTRTVVFPVKLGRNHVSIEIYRSVESSGLRVPDEINVSYETFAEILRFMDSCVEAFDRMVDSVRTVLREFFLEMYEREAPGTAYLSVEFYPRLDNYMFEVQPSAEFELDVGPRGGRLSVRCKYYLTFSIVTAGPGDPAGAGRITRAVDVLADIFELPGVELRKLGDYDIRDFVDFVVHEEEEKFDIIG